MPNAWSKFPEIIGAWIVMVIGLFFIPMFFLPVFLFGWIMWGWASPAAIYSFIYDSGHMTIAGVGLLLLLIWTEGFKASLKEAPLLAKLNATGSTSGWFSRYYLHRNRKLIEAYRDIDDFEQYLMQQNPDLYRHHTQMLSFFPVWLELHVSGHHRSGHVRHTRNGPVNVRSHYVRDHTRSKHN
jgi:hypothetical protein